MSKSYSQVLCLIRYFAAWADNALDGSEEELPPLQSAYLLSVRTELASLKAYAGQAIAKLDCDSPAEGARDEH